MIFPEPNVREDKPDFNTIPQDILAKIAQITGDSVVSGSIAYGGLSASAGFVLTLSSGRRIFAKGNHPEEMAHGTANLRQEAHVYKNIPVLKEISPPFIDTVWDGDEDGWLLGLWEYIDAREKPDAHKAMAVLKQAQREPLPKNILPRAEEHNYLRLFLSPDKKWKRLRDEPKARTGFLSIFADRTAGEEWLNKNLSTLIAMQDQWPAYNMPRGLLHGDLRLDNFLFARDKTFIIDWPNAAEGPLFFDALFLASNLEGLGYGMMEDLIELWRAEQSDDAIYFLLAAMAGYFADQVYRVVPPKLPRLRWMQRCMFQAQINMLSRHGKIDSIPTLKPE